MLTVAQVADRLNVSRNWTRENIAWLSGLFEGEGCFHLQRERHINLILNLTDEDVIRRAHLISGIGRVGGPYWDRKSTKPLWRLSIWTNEHCIALCYAMYPFLGVRRRAKIEELVRAHAAKKRR